MFARKEQIELGVNVPPSAILWKSKKSTTAVPSLQTDSPEINMVNLGETPSVLKRATTATGSVAERIDPKAKDIGRSHPYGRMYMATPAVSTVPRTTPGHARIITWPKHLLKMCGLKFIASPKTSTGRKAKKTRCGSMFSHIVIDWLKAPWVSGGWYA